MLVSELMLQQTQVARVVEPYRRFLARFPTPAACAAAPVGEVLRAWQGLGYNRRAQRLHAAATTVVETHGGRLPPQEAVLRRLPGVGRYTAAAVAVLAFGADAGVVDTNVARILARAVAGRPLGEAEAWARAGELVPPGRGREWTSALFDLGALVCRSRRPACDVCPLAGGCAWRRASRPGEGGGDPRAGRERPDPAAATARGARRQPPFAGSDRQGRGRLVEALRHGDVALEAVAAVAGWPSDEPRARRAVDALVTEGLACRRGGVLTLPG